MVSKRNSAARVINIILRVNLALGKTRLTFTNASKPQYISILMFVDVSCFTNAGSGGAVPICQSLLQDVFFLEFLAQTILIL